MDVGGERQLINLMTLAEVVAKDITADYEKSAFFLMPLFLKYSNASHIQNLGIV